MALNRHEAYMLIANIMGSRSHCLKRQVGCVITDDAGHIKAIGYNGPPKNFEHCKECHKENPVYPELLPPCPAVHAEANALLQLEDRRFASILYTTVYPCIECAKMIANTNIRTIYYDQEYKTSPRNSPIVDIIFDTAGIERIKMKEYFKEAQ